jgi:MSHA biogenesis protein MshP
MRSAGEQRGFALIGALFVLVVLAALGAFAVRMNMMQQHDADLELQQLRADAAVNSGVEYAAARVTAGATCANLMAENINVAGYAVTFFPCLSAPPYLVNGVTVNVYTVTVNSQRGVYGTPEFVARTSTVRVSSL